ncbi:retropepsin-like aspartic protease [Sphingomonas sp. TREG-RG-20F-R18-01]|uniref:retropepsin-like aspartic protease n=1 Tax=Sphingomonas sp. TREG-RG-20F-R18-01 TaxID=2914982 RepID=UPI001F572FE9|nr:retropepsin-like aspartic protease [Sphingomonas sp. TREG-RG-20F-R18-01]
MVRWLNGRRATGAAVLLGAMLAPTLAQAAPTQCKLAKFLDIPVTMEGRRPMVTAQIGGREARFILDSGAFFSTIAPANAAEFGLTVLDVMPGAQLRGIGGSTALRQSTARDFTIGGQTLPRMNFAVGGTDTGRAGLLGQNILGLGDVEYDLPHGVVHLVQATGCRTANMAYWAGTRPVTVVELTPMGPGQRHTIGTVTINGVKVRAMFDSGAQGSMLTLSAARRIGVTPDSPGVVGAGFAYGLGTGRSRAWRARFTSIDIGGEAIRNPWIDIADDNLVDADMLIGIDFFTTHHLYVDNAHHRLYVTYEGGPLFGLDPKGVVDDTGKALDLTDATTAPTDAAGFSRRGAVFASHRNFDAALADFDKAVALAPKEAPYLLQRGIAHLDNRQLLLGASDIDGAIQLAPQNPEARLARARLRMETRDPKGALEDLLVADTTLAPASDARLMLGALLTEAGAADRAVPSFDAWLKFHTEDSGRARALNGRCWARGLSNQALDKALSDCDSALRLRSGDPNYLDSRALVYFRRGETAKALADYDRAVAAQPRNAWPRYMRGLVYAHAGQADKAAADRTAALALDPRVVERARRYHLAG